MRYFQFSAGNEGAGRTLAKSGNFNNKVIIVNGFPASGKTLYSPIFSSIDNVELMAFAYEIEWCSSFLYSGQMSFEAYREFVRMYVDHLVYNQAMSRNVNFRIRDLSSALKHRSRWDYIFRLFGAGDNEVIAKIDSQRPILSLTTTQQLPFLPALAESLGERLLFIETVRDPMFMVRQLTILQKTVLDQLAVKDFTMRVIEDGIKAPYLDYYSPSAVFEEIKNGGDWSKAISFLERIFDFYFNLNIDEKDLNGSKFIFIPFEKFVLSPKNWVSSVLEFTGSSWSTALDKEMKCQNVPRKLLRDGKNLRVYKRFGWSDNDKSKRIQTIEEENEVYRSEIRGLVKNEKLYMRLEKLSDRYQEWLNNSPSLNI